MIDLSPSYARHVLNSVIRTTFATRKLETQCWNVQCTFWRFLGLTYHYAYLHLCTVQQFLNETAAYMR